MNGMAGRMPHLIAALIAFIIGAYALYETQEMSNLGSVFPTTAGIVCLLGAFAIAALSFRSPAVAPEAAAQMGWARFAAVAAVLLGWALLLKPLGFLLTSVAGMLAIFFITKREPIRLDWAIYHVLAALFLLGGSYLLLVEVLRVALP